MCQNAILPLLETLKIVLFVNGHVLSIYDHNICSEIFSLIAYKLIFPVIFSRLAEALN